MSIDMQRNGLWMRVNAPTPEHPYWHEEDGTRLHFLDVAASASSKLGEIRALHSTAIAALLNASFIARDAGDHTTSRKLISAAARGCEEAAGLWPVRRAA